MHNLHNRFTVEHTSNIEWRLLSSEVASTMPSSSLFNPVILQALNVGDRLLHFLEWLLKALDQGVGFRDLLLDDIDPLLEHFGTGSISGCVCLDGIQVKVRLANLFDFNLVFLHLFLHRVKSIDECVPDLLCLLAQL